MMTPAPILHTDRLTLRGPETADVEHIIAFYADAERSVGFGGQLPRDEAWRWFASVIGHWHLRGYGFWTVTLKDSGTPCGFVGIWNPEGWPEPELGWMAFEGFEGQGLIHEAALTVRNHAYSNMGFTTMTSNINPGNDRSVNLATRLGAVHETTYENVNMGTEMLFRHPAPDAVTT